MALKGIGLNGKAEIHMRKLKMWLLGLAAAAMLSVSACAQEIPEGSLNGNGSVSAEENQAESADGDSQVVSSSENGGNRVSSASGTSFNLADVPAYSGQPYVAVNGNVPYFTDADLTDVSLRVTVIWTAWGAAAWHMLRFRRTRCRRRSAARSGKSSRRAGIRRSMTMWMESISITAVI